MALFALLCCAHAAKFIIEGDTVVRAVAPKSLFQERGPLSVVTARIDTATSNLPARTTPLFYKFDSDENWRSVALPPHTHHWAAAVLPSSDPAVMPTPSSITCVGVLRCGFGGRAACLFVSTLSLRRSPSEVHWEVQVHPFLAPPLACTPRRFSCLPAERNGTVAVARWVGGPARPAPPRGLSRLTPTAFFVCVTAIVFGYWYLQPTPAASYERRRGARGARSSSAGRASEHQWGGERGASGAASAGRARSVGPSEFFSGAPSEPPLSGAFEMLVRSMVLRARQAELLSSGDRGVVRERLG
jgi:hypothetical protein